MGEMQVRILARPGQARGREGKGEARQCWKDAMEGMEPRQGKHLQAMAPSAAGVKGPPFCPSLALSLSLSFSRSPGCEKSW